MGTLQRILAWSSTHHPKWLVVLRVALGLCLFFKGISFMNNAVMVNQLISGRHGIRGERLDSFPHYMASLIGWILYPDWFIHPLGCAYADTHFVGRNHLPESIQKRSKYRI